jgi:hypothetical protein
MEKSVVDEDPHQRAAISPDLVINTRGSIDGNGSRDRRERGPAEQRLRRSSQGATHGGQNPGTFGAQSQSGRWLDRRSFDEAFIQQQNPCCPATFIFLEARNQGQRGVCVTTEVSKGMRNCAGKKVKPLTRNRHPDRLLERRKSLRRRTARITLAALLTCGAIAGTGISSPAQNSQPDYKQPPTPPTRQSQIDRRRIGPVILAASGPTGQDFVIDK